MSVQASFSIFDLLLRREDTKKILRAAGVSVEKTASVTHPGVVRRQEIVAYDSLLCAEAMGVNCIMLSCGESDLEKSVEYHVPIAQHH